MINDNKISNRNYPSIPDLHTKRSTDNRLCYGTNSTLRQTLESHANRCIRGVETAKTASLQYRCIWHRWNRFRCSIETLCVPPSMSQHSNSHNNVQIVESKICRMFASHTTIDDPRWTDRCHHTGTPLKATNRDMEEKQTSYQQSATNNQRTSIFRSYW